MDLKEILREIVKTENEEMYSLACKVVEVSEDKRTLKADPINGNARLYDVRLQSEIGYSTGLVIFPKVGSVVIVTFINNFVGFVSLCTEIERVVLDCEEIAINGGDNKGLVKVEPLTDKINTLENELNSLKNLLASWLPVATDGGASLKTLLAGWFNSQITITLEDDLENKKVTH